MNKKSINTQKLVLLGLFTAILVALNATGLAFIRLPFISLTILDIIVIIGAIVLGPSCGAVLGGIFGCISMWEATRATTISDIVFSPFISGSPVSSLIMALGARVFFAYMAGLIFKQLKKKNVNDYISVLAAVLSGLVIHNVLVIGCMCLLFPELGVPLKKIIISIVSVSFLIKIVISFVLAAAFSRIYSKAIRPKVKAEI